MNLPRLVVQVIAYSDDGVIGYLEKLLILLSRIVWIDCKGFQNLKQPTPWV
jgi:hypothetical protein